MTDTNLIEQVSTTLLTHLEEDAKVEAALSAANVTNTDLKKDYATLNGRYETLEQRYQDLLAAQEVDDDEDPPRFGLGGGNVQRTDIDVDRRYYGSTQAEVAKAEKDLRTNAAKGILSWVSFKCPHSWADMAAGKGNAWFLDICVRLVKAIDADDDIEDVYISIHHEPEGDADEDDWRAMQANLSVQVPGGIVGPLKYILTTTGWNQEFNANRVASEVDWETNLYPWGSPIWGIAYDAPYNTYGIETATGKMNNAWTDPLVYVDALADRAAAISAKEGRTGRLRLRAGIGEMGYSNEAFTKDKTWLEKVFNRATERGLFAVAYFDTTLNSSKTWTLGAANSAKRTYAMGLIAARRLKK